MPGRTMDWKGIGERLLLARRRRQWTSAALAREAGTTRVTISKLEHGNKPHISVTVLVHIADALGISLDYVIGTRQEDDTHATKDPTTNFPE